MSNSVVTYSDMERMAQAIAKSQLFGMKTADQAIALMALCQAEGLHPAIAARDYHIIQGRPTLKADAMLHRFLTSGGKVEWHSYTDDEVCATFSHPVGGTVKVDWTPERAKKARIANDMHQKYPRQMLRARVISEGIRTVYPGVAIGIYTPEEAADMGPQSPLSAPIDPRPENMKIMDAEKLDQYSESIKRLLDEKVADMPKPDAARHILKALDIWDELTEDEQVQVHDKLNSKQQAKLKAFSALSRMELTAQSQIVEGEIVTKEQAA